jgi:hypothetical protein
MNSILGCRDSRDPNELHFIRRVKCHMLHAVVARTASLYACDVLVTGTKGMIKCAHLSQPNDDGIFLKVVPFSGGDFYGEHSQHSLYVCGVDGYLDQGLSCANL